MDPLISQLSNQCPGTLSGVPAHLFLTLLQALINAQCDLKPPPIKNYAENVIDMENFDFIVIGAGSAGSVVANRLSEKYNVLLLEAGEEPTATSHVPATFFNLQETPETWKYEPEEQEYSCQGFTNKKCKWYTGRALGGSSSVNGMLYVRGNRYDYNRWEELGNPGWGWEDVMKYFKKSEDNQEYKNPEYHGTGGNLKVGNFELDIPVKDTILKAVEEVGLPVVKDIHNGTYIYFGNTQGTVYNGKRFSTYMGYLQPAKERKNLKIITGAYVTKIIINPKTKTAEAVEVKIKDKILKLQAKKEIILSAGGLKSPQILMLSGVGPKEHLDEFNIPVIQNLQVGKNLQDHLMFLGYYVKLPDELIPQGNPYDTLYDFFMNRKGKLSTAGLTSFVGFINTLKDSEYPDIQYLHGYFPKNDLMNLPLVLRVTGTNEETKKSILEANKHSALLAAWTKLLRPKSIGELKLKSIDPFDSPKLISNYLKDPEDVETMYRGVRFIESLTKTESLKSYNPEILNFKLPVCDKHEFLSEEYWKCSIRSLTTTVYHYSGTAKMGPSTDKNAVVDSRLKVYGINKLRVVDNSIMPYIISGNTNAPAIMIGEKGADMILQDWEDSKDEL